MSQSLCAKLGQHDAACIYLWHEQSGPCRTTTTIKDLRRSRSARHAVGDLCLSCLLCDSWWLRHSHPQPVQRNITVRGTQHCARVPTCARRELLIYVQRGEQDREGDRSELMLRGQQASPFIHEETTGSRCGADTTELRSKLWGRAESLTLFALLRDQQQCVAECAANVTIYNTPCTACVSQLVALASRIPSSRITLAVITPVCYLALGVAANL